MELAKALRRSENEFVGVGSGLLDQFSSLFGRADHALFLDCDTLIHDRLPLGKPAPAIVVCDSKTSRRLADGMYDQRRAECDRVAAVFRDRIPHRGEFQLSWLSLEQLEAEWDHLDPVGRKRARHVLSENERVRQGVEALKSGDVAAFGRLMSASHASSRDDFENSSPALDALIEAAEAAPGFLGGKLSGAGWAGCTVNLVRAEHAPTTSPRPSATAYARKTGTTPEIHICRAADGAFGLDLVPVRLLNRYRSGPGTCAIAITPRRRTIACSGHDAGGPDRRVPRGLRQFRRLRPGGDPARSRVPLELGPQLLVPRDPSDRDRDRGRRGTRRDPLPADRLGSSSSGRWPGRPAIRATSSATGRTS